MTDRKRTAYVEGSNPLVGSWTRPHYTAEGGRAEALDRVLNQQSQLADLSHTVSPQNLIQHASSFLRSALEAMKDYHTRPANPEKMFENELYGKNHDSNANVDWLKQTRGGR